MDKKFIQVGTITIRKFDGQKENKPIFTTKEKLQKFRRKTTGILQEEIPAFGTQGGTA